MATGVGVMIEATGPTIGRREARTAPTEPMAQALTSNGAGGSGSATIGTLATGNYLARILKASGSIFRASIRHRLRPSYLRSPS